MFDTSVSLLLLHRKIYSDKKTNINGPEFLHLCMNVFKTDEIQLFVNASGWFLSDYSCAFINRYVCTLKFPGACKRLSLAVLTNTAQKMYKPWIYERGRTEQRQGQSTERVPDKNRKPHVEPLSAPDLLTSVKTKKEKKGKKKKTHIALILQWRWHNLPLWSAVCNRVSRLWELSCIKRTNTKTQEDVLSRSVRTTRKIHYLAKKRVILKTKMDKYLIYFIIRPTLQNYKSFLK